MASNQKQVSIRLHENFATETIYEQLDKETTRRIWRPVLHYEDGMVGVGWVNLQNRWGRHKSFLIA